MVLNRLVGQMLIGLTVWAVLIIIGRIKNPKYSNLRAKLIDSKGTAESDEFDQFWKQRDVLERPGGSREFTLEKSYLYYYTHSMNYLGIAFLSIITLAFVYYLPLALTSYFGIDNLSTILMTLRKTVQVLSIVLAFFGFFAHHRCHYQVEIIYKELTK